MQCLQKYPGSRRTGSTKRATYIRDESNSKGYVFYQYHLPNRNGVSCTTGTCVTLSSMT